MIICDTDKLHKMVDDFCIEKRPKSIDIHKMIRECTVNKHVLQQKEFKPNYDNDLEITDAIRLEMAMDVFAEMFNCFNNISIKQFLEHYMWLYDLTEADLLGYMTEEIDD